MRLILAFLSGLACAVLLGAAAPRGAPIKWQYRLLDLDAEACKLRQYVDEVTSTTRMNFASDHEAMLAAEADAASTWHARTFGDGWLPLAALAIAPNGSIVTSDPSSRMLLIGRPLGLRAAPATIAFDQEGIIGEVAARDQLEVERATAAGRVVWGNVNGGWSAADWENSDARRQFMMQQVRQRLDACGARGDMLTVGAPLFGHLSFPLTASTLSD